MASNSEAGHASNVANFQILVNNVTGIGERYKPSNPLLQVTALNPQLTACTAAHSAVKDPLAAKIDTVSDRAALYKPLSKLVTRLFAIFKVSGAKKQVKDNAKTIADKIRGMSKKQPPVPGEDPYSTSQRSFVMQADNFETFISILSVEPTYAPAETELQVATLQAMLTDMRKLTNDVDLVQQVLKKVRIARNTAFYAAETGLVDVALTVKEYVKGAFGTNSPEYKAIKGLKFKRLEEDPNA